MKIDRHSKIVELVSSRRIETQEELAALLNENGFHVTQATVSRDIRELNLTKVSSEGGKQYYTIYQSTTSAANNKYLRIFMDGFVSMDMAQNILVIRTVSGMAMAVAAAFDSLQFNEVVGCIAGDDTIFCAVRSVDETIVLMDKIRRLMGNV